VPYFDKMSRRLGRWLSFSFSFFSVSVSLSLSLGESGALPPAKAPPMSLEFVFAFVFAFFDFILRHHPRPGMRTPPKVHCSQRAIIPADSVSRSCAGIVAEHAHNATPENIIEGDTEKWCGLSEVAMLNVEVRRHRLW